MSYQESAAIHQYLQQLSMLRLSSAAPSPETTTSKTRLKFKKCRECGTLKRPSPSSSLQEPSPKRPIFSLDEEEEIPFSHSENVILSASSSPELGQIQNSKTPPFNPISQQTPNSKRLKRMKKRMREMRKWVGEVIEEQDVEDHISEDQNSKVEIEKEHQEAVYVEKKGDGLVIKFKCTCGEGYEIFLCGNNCYYKLM